MLSYEKDGFKMTIMLSHVICLSYYDGQDSFNVFVDDGTGEPYEVPVEYYYDFKNTMFKYLQAKGKNNAD